jgi:AraC-like DNA-binding protein
MLSISQRPVDLWGRLSNPPNVVETLAEQGSQTSRGPRKAKDGMPNRASEHSAEAAPEEKGRLSNPVQRRLSGAEVGELARRYLAGSSLDALAREYRVHRTTVIRHLDRLGVPRRRVVRKLTDEAVAWAAARYREGASLAVVSGEFGVHQRTLAREFRGADMSIRPRRGC